MRHFERNLTDGFLTGFVNAEAFAQSIRNLQAENPNLLNTMLRSYVSNPVTELRLRQLQHLINRRNQALIRNTLAGRPSPISTGFNFSCGLQRQLYIKSLELSIGPKLCCELPSGKAKLSLYFSLVFDQVTKSKAAIKGFMSLSKRNIEVITTRGIDLSGNYVERSFTLQTSFFNHSKVGLQVKDHCSRNIRLLSPSNIVNNGFFVVSSNNHCVKGIESQGSVCVMPFRTIKERIASHMANKQTQKEIIQQIQRRVYMLRVRKILVSVFLFIALVSLFVFVISRIRSFLKNKKIRQGQGI